MAKRVSLYEAKTNLSALVEEAAAGEEIVVTKHGKAKARLVPMDAEPGAAAQAERGQARHLEGCRGTRSSAGRPGPSDARGHRRRHVRR